MWTTKHVLYSGALLGLSVLSASCSLQLIQPQDDPFYQAIEASQDKHDAALLGLGLDAYQAGQYESAEEYLADFVDLRPKHALGWYYLANCQLEQKKFKRSVHSFEHSLKLEQRQESMVGLFYAQLYQGKTEEARSTLAEIKAHYNKEYLTYRLEGELLFGEKAYEASLKSFRLSLGLMKNQPDVEKKDKIT